MSVSEENQSFELRTVCCLFAGYGPSASYRTEKGRKCVQIDYPWNPGGEDYGVRVP